MEHMKIPFRFGNILIDSNKNDSVICILVIVENETERKQEAIRIGSRLKLMRALKFMYGNEMWTLTAGLEEKLEMRCYRRVLDISPRDHYYPWEGTHPGV